MNIVSTPDTLQKLQIAGDTTAFEPAGDQPQREARPKRLPHDLPCVTEVATPKG
ncbi:MAG: hypothetical protein R3E39_05215 [Anaerolineae bacterium]